MFSLLLYIEGGIWSDETDWNRNLGYDFVTNYDLLLRYDIVTNSVPFHLTSCRTRVQLRGMEIQAIASKAAGVHAKVSATIRYDLSRFTI